jgi:hypothetical protein
MTFKEILTELSKPLDPAVIKQREGWKGARGTTMVKYIEWSTAADILDRVCPWWTYEVVEFKEVSGLFICKVRITVYDDNGTGVFREGIGTDETGKGEMGAKGAESDALKRAATKFGIGRELYDKETNTSFAPAGQQQQQRSYSGGGNAVGQAAQGAPTRPVSDKQLQMIYNLGRDKGVNPDEMSLGKFQKTPDKLTSKEASAFITDLIGIEAPKGQNMAQYSQGQNAKPATEAQMKAIGSLCDRVGTTLEVAAMDLGYEAGNLSVSEASEIIKFLQDEQGNAGQYVGA